MGRDTGMDESRFSVRVQAAPFDVGVESALLAQGRTDIGAIVTFTGLCRADPRADGTPLQALVLEHYPGMAEEEILRHVETARSRWELQGVQVIHRHGRITPGEPIVLVVTTSAHRGDAFAAAEFLMDWLKTNAPFWKKEEWAEGTGNWVEAKTTDDAARERWSSGETQA